MQQAEHRLRLTACAEIGVALPVGSGVCLADDTLLAHSMLARNGRTTSRSLGDVDRPGADHLLPPLNRYCRPTTSFLYLFSFYTFCLFPFLRSLFLSCLAMPPSLLLSPLFPLPCSLCTHAHTPTHYTHTHTLCTHHTHTQYTHIHTRARTHAHARAHAHPHPHPHPRTPTTSGLSGRKGEKRKGKSKGGMDSEGGRGREREKE
eukprot:1829140-Pleurochrysis_carterae.AAC.1